MINFQVPFRGGWVGVGCCKKPGIGSKVVNKFQEVFGRTKTYYIYAGGNMLYQTRQSKILFFLLFMAFLATTIACGLLQSAAPSKAAPTSAFKPGEPTATPLGTDITDINFIKGVEAYQAKKYDKVIALMSAVIDSDPNLAPPHRYRGMAYWYLGDCAGALPDIEKALSINPNYATAWADHGLLKGCLGDREQEFQDYEKALSLDPSLAKVHQNRGVAYYDMKDFEKALEEYDLSIAIDPARAASWSGKGEALGQLGRFGECIVAATKSLEINPEEYSAYSVRAYCEQNLENYPAAVKDYEIYTANHENIESVIWYNIGIAHDKNGDPQTAIDSYSKALELDPSYYPANINRGIAYNEIKDYENALSDFNAALEFGDIAYAYINRGETYYWLENYDQAIVDLELALSLDPNNIRAACYLTRSFFSAGRYQDALDASSQIVFKCRIQDIFEIQARSYYALGNFDQGILYMDKAIAEGPYPLGYYYRGIIFQAAGRNEEAIQDLELFLSLIPSTGEYKEETSDAKLRLAKLK
jgi:tetratricopeptide (TPR) repeat protein